MLKVPAAMIAITLLLLSCQGCAPSAGSSRATINFVCPPENASAVQFREANLKVNVYKSADEMSWLTDEYLANHRKQGQEVKTEVVNVERGQIHIATTYAGNHFYVDTGENGKMRWNWTSGDPGNAACGQTHALYCYPGWYSNYSESNYVCHEGYHWYEIRP